MNQNLTELKEERSNPTIVVRDFSMHFSSINRQTRQKKVSENIEYLNNTIHHLNLINTYIDTTLHL